MRWGLWAAGVLLVPLPFFLVVTGLVPVARIGMLAAVLLALIAAEGAHGLVGVLAALVAGQAVLYALLLWWLAGVAARLATRASARAAVATTTALLLVSVVVAASFEIYRTPFRTESLRASLWQIFE